MVVIILKRVCMPGSAGHWREVLLEIRIDIIVANTESERQSKLVHITNYSWLIGALAQIELHHRAKWDVLIGCRVSRFSDVLGWIVRRF